LAFFFLSYTPYYSFGHCIVCSSLSYSSLLLFWPLHCLFFFKRVIRSCNSKKNRQCSGQRSNKEQ
jgi:hypothetical protein